MSAVSHIEWTDASWNPIRARREPDSHIGWVCQRVSPGCQHCYAETINKRLGTGLGYDAKGMAGSEPFLDERVLLQPLKWRKARKVFVCSMTDIAGEWVPDEWLDRMFAVMALTPQHTYQLLTKRPGRLREYLTGLEADRLQFILQERAWDLVCKYGRSGEHLLQTKKRVLMGIRTPLPNVWMGTSVEDQERADVRIPELLETPAAVRFLSCEPLLGPVSLRPEWLGMVQGPHEWHDLHAEPMVHWVIVGGESGAKARPMDLEWARSLVAECQEAGVAVFLKQLGARPVTTTADWYSSPAAIRDAATVGTKDVDFPFVDAQVGRGVSTFGSVVLPLRDRKGGIPEEWPEDLRVREWPR